jgi:hypothetical protein
VAKLNVSGTALVYSTYLGGSGDDSGNGIAVDSAGNAFVTGETGSTNFPTANPLQPTYGGGFDAFVAKLNASGTALVYSTYLGGSGDDSGNGIALDSAGNAYVTGNTNSTDFPTVKALQPTPGSLQASSPPSPVIPIHLPPPQRPNDVFLAKLNSSGTALVYSTYLGGSSEDSSDGIAVDSAGNAYVTGYTHSTNFPTVNPLQPTPGGAGDAFVAKIGTDNGPIVVSLKRFGIHAQPTTLVLTFDHPLDPTRAQDLGNYRLVSPHGRPIGIASAAYDPATPSVTLSPAHRLDIHYRYRLTVVGTGPYGLTDIFGLSLNAKDAGPGSDYVATVTRHNLVLPDRRHIASLRDRAHREGLAPHRLD